MLFIAIGVLIILLHLAGIGPMADWTWRLTGDLWKFCLPFILAAVWWFWSDSTGRTRRLEMEKMDQRKEARRRKNMVALGIDPRAHDKRSARAAEYRAKRASRAAKVEATGAKKRDSVLSNYTEGELRPEDDRPSWVRTKL